MYPIPANATRIRYLESTGTQHIDTGVVPGSGWRAEVVFRLAGTTARGMFGVRTSSSSSDAFGCFIDPSTIFPQYGSSQSSMSKTISSSVDHKLVIGADSYLDGTLLRSASGTFTCPSSLILFALKSGSSIDSRKFYGRIISFKIYNSSNELVRSYVPVRVDTVGYLFDRVSGQLFGNAGTGSFVLGSDTFKQGVVPTRMMPMGVRKKLPYDKEVEYLQSSGMQYINTGVLPSVGMEIGVKCSASSVSANGWDGVVGTWIADKSDECISVRYNTMTKIAPTYAGAVRYAGVGEWIAIQSGSVLEIVLREGFASINGTEYTWNTVPFTAPSFPFFCFVENLGGSPWSGRYLKGRIYYLWMMRNGKLVFDAIPVRSGSTGYLYDRANPTGGPNGNGLYGNAGTGSFVLGPDK